MDRKQLIAKLMKTDYRILGVSEVPDLGQLRSLSDTDLTQLDSIIELIKEAQKKAVNILNQASH